MSVDMYERRFRQELEKVERFQPQGQRDPRVWAQEFPAWRALFTAMCLWGHSTGYRLFSYKRFFDYCRTAYSTSHSHPKRFQPFFEEPLLPGMRKGVGVWYESGMAETYLYVCLVEAIEDKLREGIVLYDPRVDWKLKGDILVILRGKPMIVSAFFGELEGRPNVEARRDRVESVRKVNTSESSHWRNTELGRTPKYEITRDEKDYREV